MKLEKLNRTEKPLVEAVFEVRWQLREQQPGILHDPGFKFLVGSYYQQVKDEYPIAVELPISRVPIEFSPYVVRVQFWAGDNEWPVTQIGPGVMTVNQTTEGYGWDSFRPRLIDAVHSLFKVYPNVDDFSLMPNWVELRYNNAIPYDPKAGPILSFLEKRLHAKIEIDEEFFSSTGAKEDALSLGLNLSFSLPEIPAILLLTFNTGLRDNQPFFLWETTVRSFGTGSPTKPEDYEGWLDKAHFVARKSFETLSAGELFKSFKE